MNSIKKNLPAGCRDHTPSKLVEWERLACSPPPPPPDEYLAFVKAETSRLFPPGWDRPYHSFVGSYLPNPSARKPKLSRADILWSGRRGEFFTKTTSETALAPLMEARYKEVTSAGKCRPLLIYDEQCDLLAPLHKLMYHQLRKQDWLLCGPPTEERVTSVCVNEHQTSVDLVNATDGLFHVVAETILDAAFFTSVKIPRSLRAFAKASLSPIFRGSGGTHRRVRHGQMMGAYLSFPLLCIQSYCAARWATRDVADTARFLVNGDDTLISAEREVTDADYPPGARLNVTKTIRARNVCEINSTAFLRSRGRWREVRHLRRGGAPSDYVGMLHMADAVRKAGPAWVDAFQRARIGRRWGFLPSQLGHLVTYSAYKRQSTMTLRRGHTPLPDPALRQDESQLRRITGRDPTAVEAEALRSYFWQNGRRGGMKRDVYNPSVGCIRRTYLYRKRVFKHPVRGRSSSRWVGVRKMIRLEASRRPPPRFFLLPEEFETDEEKRALDALQCYWRGWHVDGCPHALDIEG